MGNGNAKCRSVILLIYDPFPLAPNIYILNLSESALEVNKHLFSEKLKLVILFEIRFYNCLLIMNLKYSLKFLRGKFKF